MAGPAESHPAERDGQPVWSAWQIGKMIGYRLVIVSNVYGVKYIKKGKNKSEGNRIKMWKRKRKRKGQEKLILVSDAVVGK